MKQRHPTHKKPHVQRCTEHLQQSHPPNHHPNPAFQVPAHSFAQCFQKHLAGGKGPPGFLFALLSLKNVPTNPRRWPDFSRGAGYLLTASLKINKNDRCSATLQIRPLSNQSAFPSFYVLHITGLSNHVGIDYYCYYLLNSYFLLLG